MLEALLTALALIGILYWLLAWESARRFFGRQRPEEGTKRPSVSILKPVEGVDGGTYDNFASFCRQTYPDYELLFGVSDPSDPAVATVRRLQRRFPARSIRLIVARARAANPKSGIVTALVRQSRCETLAISDADIRVGSDYLNRVVAPLERDAVGAVTCLYRDEPARGLVGQMAALYLAAGFFPSAILANRTLGIGFGMGATIVLRRTDLERLGGYASFADRLADDYEIGARVAALGLDVWLSDYVVTNVGRRSGVAEQWYRELRWARGIRVSRPHQYLGLLVTHVTPLAAAAALISGFTAGAMILLLAALVLRWLLARDMAKRLDEPLSALSVLALPLRDAWSAAVWAAGLFGKRIVWRGHVYSLQADGRLVLRT